jgi:hypothetical protein
MNEVALEARIASAIEDEATSGDILALIKETEAAVSTISVSINDANVIADSAVRSIAEKRDARDFIAHATRERDRLQSEIAVLCERLQEVRAEEKAEGLRPMYKRVKAERDRLAAELADGYPQFARWLADLLPRMVANDREIEYLNASTLPSDCNRLSLAEEVARGGRISARIVTDLRLPAWESDAREPYAWPIR